MAMRSEGLIVKLKSRNTYRSLNFFPVFSNTILIPSIKVVRITNGFEFANKKLARFVNLYGSAIRTILANLLFFGFRLPVAFHNSFGRIKNKINDMVALGRSANFSAYHFKGTAHVVFSHK